MTKSLISRLSLTAGLCLVGASIGARAQAEPNAPHAPRPALTTSSSPKAIAIRQDATGLETLAAKEIRRYVYLRTGKLLPVKRGRNRGERIVVSCRNSRFCGDVGSDLQPQEFTLQTRFERGKRTWWVVGGDAIGTLYGAYRLAEKLGVSFGLDGDALPESRLDSWPNVNETGIPRFALRGLQPFHDFSVGPDWWNLADYESVLSQMVKLRLNFIGLHTYPSWNPAAGPEANVWIGLPEDVDAQGNVRFGYESGVVTTRRGWAVTPFPTSRYACGAGQLFESDDYAPDFMLECLDWPKTADAAAAMFNRYGDLQQQAFSQARRLGIKTCLGTEVPLGIPASLAARLQAQGMKPDASATIQRLYEGTFLRLMRKIPVDYYWLWTPEIWLGQDPGFKGWEIASTANVARDFRLVEAAARAVKAPFGLATCGWRLGTRNDALWTDAHTPTIWAASSIGTGLGRDPVETAFGKMPNRPKWVIGWAEDDDAAGAHCCTAWDLQLWADRMFANSDEAFRYGCAGMMAIHWRTAAIEPNIAALAQAGWSFRESEGGKIDPTKAADRKAEMGAFWTEWGRSMFGGDAGAEAGHILQKLDGSHPGINALIRGGAATGDASIAHFFTPLQELEALRPRIQGTGNRERCDYWLNLIRASQRRVRTWVLADRLTAEMKKAAAIPDAKGKRNAGENEVLPMRLELARSYENMISAFLDCAESAGEVGTISSIESGSRSRIVTAHDSEIAQILGRPLPAEATIRTDYRGAPRVFVPAVRTQTRRGAGQEIRAFVLSGEPCTGMALFWRSLGRGHFKKVAAAHRNRNAYRVALPAASDDIEEYYLEATLESGRKLLWPATAPAMNQTVTVW